ncbi:MAG: tetratricopeptide repeat protein [Alphaproteobacteria bacterium]|nr:tetratricopeptide repeat protein [Alphaproteobacteria bacterium]
MLKRMAVVASLVLPLLPATALGEDLNQDLAWCNGNAASDEQTVSGCTAVIQSGRATSDEYVILVNRGLAYDDLGQHARAIQDYDQAIRLNPAYEEAFGSRGVAYGELGQYARSIQDFDQAIRLNPGDAHDYYYRSVSKRRLGDSAGADEDLAKAKAIDPSIGGSGNSSSPSSNAPAPGAQNARSAAPANNATFGLGNTLQQAAPTPNAPAADSAAPGSDAIEVEYWRTIENSKNPEDFEAYLKKFPNGHFADLAWNRFDALRAPADVCQSMVGTWSWFINGDVTFDADGTARQTSGFKATWTCHNGDVKIFWPMGIVDTLALSADGRHLRGRGGVFGLSEVTGDRK